jgi:hypothetical protein
MPCCWYRFGFWRGGSWAERLLRLLAASASHFLPSAVAIPPRCRGAAVRWLFASCIARSPNCITAWIRRAAGPSNTSWLVSSAISPLLFRSAPNRATSALAKRSMNDAHDRSKRTAGPYQPSMRKRASTDAPLVTKIREAVAQTEALHHVLGKLRAGADFEVFEHAIAVLMGMRPAELTIKRAGLGRRIPIVPPDGLPCYWSVGRCRTARRCEKRTDWRGVFLRHHALRILWVACPQLFPIAIANEV